MIQDFNEKYAINNPLGYCYPIIYVYTIPDADHEGLVKIGFTHGRFNLPASEISPNDLLIRSLVDGFVNDLEIKFKNEKLVVEKIEALKTPEFSEKSEFKTLSPINIRDMQEVDGKIKRRDTKAVV